MYRHLAYEALRRGFTQYFDQMEPLLPPPNKYHYIEDGSEIHVRTINDDIVALLKMDTIAHTVTVRIPLNDLYHFLPGDEEIDPPNHVPIQRNRVIPDEYILRVDMSDADWDSTDADDIFLVNRISRPKRPQRAPSKGKHMRYRGHRR